MNFINSESKNIINNYLRIIEEDYDIKNNLNYSNLYIELLLIPVLEKWRKTNFSECYEEIEKVNNMLKKYNIKYMPNINIFSYYNSIIYCDLFQKSKDIFELIYLLRNINNKYKESYKINNKLKKLENNTNNIKEIKDEKLNDKKTINFNKIKHKENINLDTLKVIGLRDLCVKLNINTYKCKKRNDYIELLLPYIN